MVIKVKKDDLVKKTKMLWAKNPEMVTRSKLIQNYIETCLHSSGINSENLVLLVIDFEDTKVTEDLVNKNDTNDILIRINYLNMNGDVEPLLVEIDDIINKVKSNSFRRNYSIDKINKGINR